MAIITVLQDSLQAQRLVSLYTNQNATDKFWAGYLLQLSDDKFLLEAIDPLGNYDGIVAKSIADVFLIEYETEYTQKLQKLHQKKATHNRIKQCVQHEDLFVALMLEAKENKTVVSIQLFDSGFNDAQGYVEEATESDVKIRVLNDNGEPNGYAYIATDSISCVFCDSQETQALMLLAQSNT